MYGVLYNWYTINTGKLCPAGWHVPTDAGWSMLENYLIANGYNYDGTTDNDGDRSTLNKIAKSLAASTNWLSSTNTGAVGNTDYPDKRNATGFSTLPGGYRYFVGIFTNIGYGNLWWSSTGHSTNNAYYRGLSYDLNDMVRSNYNKRSGFSVRCVKD